MTEEDGATGEASPAARPSGHPTSCGEPVFLTLFSGAATLIQPCSQAGGEPDPALLLASGSLIRPCSETLLGHR